MKCLVIFENTQMSGISPKKQNKSHKTRHDKEMGRRTMWVESGSRGLHAN